MKSSVVLDKRRGKKDGVYPVALRIFSNTTMYFGLGMEGTEATFENGEFTKRDKSYRIKNLKIGEILNKVERIIIDLDASIGDRKLREIINDALGKRNKGKKRLFVDYLDEFVSTKSNKGTRMVYATTKNKIMDFDEKATLESMDKRWLERFEKWMVESGMKVNAYAINLRNIRAVFNYAIDNEYTSLYPFRKFKIRKEETRKRSLSVEQVRLLRDYPCEEYQERYRDMFLLMLYLIGINAVDLFLARPDALDNGRIEYKRAKTGKLYSIKVEPEAMEIIRRHKGKKYLLNIMDEYRDYKNFLHRMGLALKEIGPMKRVGRGGRKVREPLFPEISSYWSRHTWATLAASLDIPKETISEALGHSIGSEVTSIYIQFDRSKIDVANRAVLDLILGDKDNPQG